MPYPGLIREVWKELPGKSISKLKDDPYYPNDPSLIEIIENFDSPFDIDKDYGSRVKGYFVAPETGNYTFYMSGSQSGELWMSSTESQQNLTKMVSLDQATGHNQWNKYVFSLYSVKRTLALIEKKCGISAHWSNFDLTVLNEWNVEKATLERRRSSDIPLIRYTRVERKCSCANLSSNDG